MIDVGVEVDGRCLQTCVGIEDAMKAEVVWTKDLLDDELADAGDSVAATFPPVVWMLPFAVNGWRTTTVSVVEGNWEVPAAASVA